MYSIKEVQIKSGLPASTLRYYEKEGILPDVGRDEGEEGYIPKNKSIGSGSLWL